MGQVDAIKSNFVFEETGINRLQMRLRLSNQCTYKCLVTLYFLTRVTEGCEALSIFDRGLQSICKFKQNSTTLGYYPPYGSWHKIVKKQQRNPLRKKGMTNLKGLNKDSDFLLPCHLRDPSFY